MNKVKFIRKAVDLDDLKQQMPKSLNQAKEYVIEKTIELDKNEWDCLIYDFFGYKDYIKENLGLMYEKDNVWHCILITTKNCDIGILLQTEGYGYARYTSVIKLSEVAK